MSILATEFKITDAAKVWKKEGIEEGIEVGRAQGIEVGRAETQMEIARELLTMNLKIQDVIKATGLSADQVVSLVHQRRP